MKNNVVDIGNGTQSPKTSEEIDWENIDMKKFEHLVKKQENLTQTVTTQDREKGKYLSLLKKRLFKAEFRTWKAGLEEEEKNEIYQNDESLPVQCRKDKIAYYKMNSLKRYFKQRIWPQRLALLMEEVEL